MRRGIHNHVFWESAQNKDIVSRLFGGFIIVGIIFGALNALEGRLFIEIVHSFFRTLGHGSANCHHSFFSNFFN